MRSCGGRGNLLRWGILCAHQFVVEHPQITRSARWGKERLREQSGINCVLEGAQLFAHRYT